jgi:hypothetical protein
MKLVAFDRADHRQRRTGAAAGVFDDAHAFAEGAALLRAFDHRQRHAVFVGAGRVEIFELDDDLGGTGRHDLAQPEDRGVADGFEDGINRGWRRHRWFDVGSDSVVSVPHFLPARGMLGDGATGNER